MDGTHGLGDELSFAAELNELDRFTHNCPHSDTETLIAEFLTPSEFESKHTTLTTQHAIALTSALPSFPFSTSGIEYQTRANRPTRLRGPHPRFFPELLPHLHPPDPIE